MVTSILRLLWGRACAVKIRSEDGAGAGRNPGQPVTSIATLAQSDANYDGTARAATNKKELNVEEETELKTARSSHPDRFAGEANTIDTYEKLTSAINRAKEEGDVEIIDKLEALNNLHESSEYELYQRSSRQPGLLDEVGANLAKVISAEIARLETEAEKLRSEIAELMEAEEAPSCRTVRCTQYTIL